MAVVELRSLVALLDGFPALTGIDLVVDSGETVLLQGPNGAGKTTLLHLCAGLIRANEGEGQILGYDLSTERNSIRQKTGLLAHNTGLYRDLTVSENIAFWSKVTGADKSEMHKRVTFALQRLGLDGSLENQKVRSLSAGQKRRVSLAVFLIRRPSLWLLDEPHAGLDQEGKKIVDDLIKDAVNAGATVMVSSHDLDWMRRLSPRIVTLAGGSVTESSSK